ncbi:transgelin [Elysia marginata]|uniref:Transgelin n=1 Tax=Elysia marginata TaxID=1093978 RepID=A0AAV4HHP7_9GAST|nr:transgelin [Elysia marginata]
MAGLRAPRAGLAREQQQKVDNAFDTEEAVKCLVWIREVTGEDIPVETVMDDKQSVQDFFYATLKDGFLLCKLANCIVPEEMQIKMKSLTFKKSTNEAFESARERSRLEIFCDKIMEYGVPETLTFQIDSLYERTNLVQVYCAIRNFGMEDDDDDGGGGGGKCRPVDHDNDGDNMWSKLELFAHACIEFGVSETNTFQIDSLYERTNLSQVCAAIRSLGIEAESRPSYIGTRMWPKKSMLNRRSFSQEQLRMGACVINLQMGTNRCANQSGLSFGKKRMITKN